MKRIHTYISSFAKIREFAASIQSSHVSHSDNVMFLAVPGINNAFDHTGLFYL